MKQVENREKITQSPERHRNGIWHGSVTWWWWRGLRILRFENRQRRQPSLKSHPTINPKSVGFSARHVTWNVFSAWHRFGNFAFRKSPQLAKIITWSTRRCVVAHVRKRLKSVIPPGGKHAHTRANLIINETFSHTFAGLFLESKNKKKEDGVLVEHVLPFCSGCHNRSLTDWPTQRTFFSGRVWRGRSSPRGLPGGMKHKVERGSGGTTAVWLGEIGRKWLFKKYDSNFFIN